MPGLLLGVDLVRMARDNRPAGFHKSVHVTNLSVLWGCCGKTTSCWFCQGFGCYLLRSMWRWWEEVVMVYSSLSLYGKIETPIVFIYLNKNQTNIFCIYRPLDIISSTQTPPESDTQAQKAGLNTLTHPLQIQLIHSTSAIITSTFSPIGHSSGPLNWIVTVVADRSSSPYWTYQFLKGSF